MKIEELNGLYLDAEACDAELFAEQRSNVLLCSGNHYLRRSSKFWNAVRRSDNLNKQQKIRLTKNHLQKITKTYANNILGFAPGVGIFPRQDAELSDVKAAELNGSVWEDLKTRHKLKKKNRQLAKDFSEIGEAVLKIFFDPNAGEFTGYEPEIDESGMPVIGEDGEPKGNPKFTGDLVYERHLAFNVLRDPEGKSWDECRFVILRKMVSIRDLKKQFEGDEDKLKFITQTGRQTYQVFDGQNGTYSTSKDMLMVREYYFRPNGEFPKGYYYITTESGILHEGEIPLAVFPIVYCGFDEAATSARSFSIIKQLRPYQAEINRCASKIAEHQITLGDDKVILQNGGTITPGGTAYGIKAVKVTGGAPTVMQGRDGSQFGAYMTAQITEMYQVANVVEDSQEKVSQVDPYALLFRNMNEKKKFTTYGEKWEEFQEEICSISIRMAKAFFPDDYAIPVVGKKEMVNIAEWKSTEDIAYQVKVEPKSEDTESIMGRQLALNHIIQFAGQQMSQSDLGQLISAMPFANKEKALSDLTIDSTNADNDILRLDRGTPVPPKKYENHAYIVKRLTHRMKQSDFEYLDPRVQQNYDMAMKGHEQVLAQEEKAKQVAEAGYIPTGGYLVTCDFYLPETDPTKQPKRARVPFEALQWLLQHLQTQGMGQHDIAAMAGGVQQDLAGMMGGQRPQQPMRPRMAPPPGQSGGMESAAGSPPSQATIMSSVMGG